MKVLLASKNFQGTKITEYPWKFYWLPRISRLLILGTNSGSGADSNSNSNSDSLVLILTLTLILTDSGADLDSDSNSLGSVHVLNLRPCILCLTEILLGSLPLVNLRHCSSCLTETLLQGCNPKDHSKRYECTPTLRKILQELNRFTLDAPTQNPDAPAMLDRILCFLASYEIITYSQVISGGDDDDGQVQRYYLKDAVLEGGIPFNKAHGMEFYEYLGMDPSFNEVFNKTMFDLSITLMKGILEIYEGFEKANVVVDVGGGLGENLDLITSKYNIKGINFDLPHVIATASAYPGVEHVAGNMFLSVPKGDIIFMKMILHNWSDDHCLRLLKKCHEALPDDGKVVVVETILPTVPETNFLAKNVFGSDLLMMAQQVGGKERTEKEYRALAMGVGFEGFKFICRVVAASIMEFHKMT
ncbi:caffeic acid 3-O-methyltransferase-like [Telopea speciosissima]|uniref:caffeic acid 3-O-methyltransferase-like n=1 Tax=Telopea speciosissima TaxID=54955 RepID=UPI001CC37B31|nr:caffeic acid 3-O-methyltransferase-like [Telopea speciosissima]